MINEFKNKNINPELSNINSWAYASNGVMYWSEADIGSVSCGDQILTMRYNKNKDTYTVGYITVNNKQSDVTKEWYNSFVDAGNGEKWYEYADATLGNQSDKTKKSFESAMDYYNKVKKTSSLVVQK